ncbi:hypothetical protein L1887_60915 [Cichorium endivia]|nr:hypothetical protein L1887_60915 [Cichorium endivia]
MDEERCAVGRGTESEAGAAGARAGAGVGLGEPRPRTGEAETAEEAQDAMGGGGDAWWKSVNALFADSQVRGDHERTSTCKGSEKALGEDEERVDL